MIPHWLDWLISGTDANTLSPEWLSEKMPEWDRWTRSQQQPGMALIVADTAETKRRQFWIRQADKHLKRRDNVAKFDRQSQR